MRNRILLIAMFVVICANSALAAPLRVYVAEMSAVGVQNKDEIKVMLQTLLASRLNSESIVVAGSAAEADAVVTGSYVAAGKVFNIDALAKNGAGKILARAFVQGEGDDALIPSVGKLADKLSAELMKGSMASPVAPPSMLPVVSDGDIIKSKGAQSNEGWLSARLEGAANLMATGRILPDGSREIFLAEDRRLSYYRQGSEMKLISEVEFKSSEKILSVDTIEGSNGVFDVYVTLFRSDEPLSQVWQVRDDKLVIVAEGLPYYFRSVALAGETKKLYAQVMGRGEDFYGGVAEATRNGSVVSLKNSLKMPRYGNIYNFNLIKDRDGKLLTVVINSDGYLIVYDQQQKELWRSDDKFGGSELYFQKEIEANVRTYGDKYRWIFLNQRLQVLPGGEILVGKNEGGWVVGNSRSYKKGAVYSLAWNGSSLEEKWRTKETQNYMPDYFFDALRNELLMLQTVQRPGFTGRGASALAIKKLGNAAR